MDYIYILLCPWLCDYTRLWDPNCHSFLQTLLSCCFCIVVVVDHVMISCFSTTHKPTPLVLCRQKVACCLEGSQSFWDYNLVKVIITTWVGEMTILSSLFETLVLFSCNLNYGLPSICFPVLLIFKVMCKKYALFWALVWPSIFNFSCPF
jgi:hypothetical protein